jgi:hypothetical protein
MTYDYECELGHRTERYLMRESDLEIKCPECGRTAPRCPSAPQSIQWSWRPDQIRDHMGGKKL